MLIFAIDSLKDFFTKLFFIFFAPKTIKKISDNLTVFFAHNLGGGTDKYLRHQLTTVDGPCLLISNYRFLIEFYVLTYNNKKYIYTFHRLKGLLNKLQVSEIIINSLVSYRNLIETLNLIQIVQTKNKCKLIILFHDFYPICPNYTLFCDNKNCTQYCSKKEIIEYKESWTKVFEIADELRVFSNSSKDILSKFRPEFSQKITVVPHSLDYLKNITPVKYQPIPPLKVGVLGLITSEIKGLDIIKKVSDNLDLYILGSTTIKKSGIHILGTYTIDSLKELIIKNRITVILFPSVWAETFSYVVSEIIALDLPIVAFPMGAQGEKVKNYSKGVLCQDFATKSIVSAIEKAYALYTNSQS